MKKFVLLSLIFLVSCGDRCPTVKIAPGFVYEAKVKIKEGFFSELNGTLSSQGFGYWNVNGEACYLPHYDVALRSSDGVYIDTVRVNQTNLELVK